ncbi:MAG: PaaI family thioesterase [Geminicoccaceae bacterium]|nr:PaaI family thioesterase [Geminicoccaceae bacterium]MCB9942370.1 PaaI family thioesterase [Geminicoccaceae bacterium]
MTPEAFHELATQGVPYVGQLDFSVLLFEHGCVDVMLPRKDLLLRPGGTVCGPAMMALADITLYGVCLSMIGAVSLAVTTDMNIHFLRRPQPGALIARGRNLKLGRTLFVGEVTIESEHSDKAVAHATGTYSIPPDQER